MKLAWRMAILAMCATIISCSDSTGPAEPFGLYVLSEINSAPLPVVTEETDTERVRALAGSLRLYSGGTFELVSFSEKLVKATGAVTTQSSQNTGTYNYGDASLTLKFIADDAIYPGTWGDETVSLSINAIVLTYRKQ